MPLQIFEQRYLDLVRESMKSAQPFGVVWIRRGEEVALQGSAQPDLGDYGTCAHIVDWDQLPNGLLGITVEGTQRFELLETSMRANGLLTGEMTLQGLPEPRPMEPQWQPLSDVLRSLETHPHVQRLNPSVDYDNAWSVGYTLLQLLPIEESVKHELLGLDTVEGLMAEMDALLNQISG